MKEKYNCENDYFEYRNLVAYFKDDRRREMYLMRYFYSDPMYLLEKYDKIQEIHDFSVPSLSVAIAQNVMRYQHFKCRNFGKTKKTKKKQMNTGISFYKFFR